MALIKCSECGADVSEKAAVCIKCGCPIDITKQIIYDNRKGKNKKLIISLMSLFVIVILAVGTIFFVKDSQAKSGLYNNIAWGTSMEDIVKIAERNTNNESMYKELVNEEKLTVNDSVVDFLGFKGLTAMVSYDCSNNKTLQSVMVTIVNMDDLECTDEMIIETITKEFDELYGKHEKDTIGIAWNSPKSKITLIHFWENMIILEYEDIATLEK